MYVYIYSQLRSKLTSEYFCLSHFLPLSPSLSLPLSPSLSLSLLLSPSLFSPSLSLPPSLSLFLPLSFSFSLSYPHPQHISTLNLRMLQIPSFFNYLQTSYSTRKWNLKLLDFSHNVITGALPPFFLYLPSLTALDLSHNLLSGMLPPFPLVSDLRRVSLRGNAISGNFPSSWERLWDVTRLSELEEQSGTDDGGMLLDVAHTCLQVGPYA